MKTLRNSIYIAFCEGVKYSALSYLATDVNGTQDSDVYIVSNRKKTANEALHIGLQRALRRVDSREGAPIQLTVHLDATTAEEIGFELMDVEGPKNPQLYRQTLRTLNRFDSWRLAAFSDEQDLTAPESAAIDNGLAALDEAVTIKGRWNLLKYRFTQPQKLIN